MQISQTISVCTPAREAFVCLTPVTSPIKCDGESGRVALKLELSWAGRVEDEQMARSTDEPLPHPPEGTCRAIGSANFQGPVFYNSEVCGTLLPMLLLAPRRALVFCPATALDLSSVLPA